MGKFCPDCGLENSDTAKFCNGCGFKIESSIEPSVRIFDRRYKLIKEIGSGGMGRVYKAEHTKLGKIVAIKEMDDSQFQTDQEKEKAKSDFEKEARILSSLSHPSLPDVTDFFTEEIECPVIKVENGKKIAVKGTETKYFLVMSYIEGKTLTELMKERKYQPFKEEECIDWFYQLLNILDYLHSQSPPVIYRDMKADNVMISDDGRIFLIDFGIAKLFQPAKKGTLIGTPGYAPPEQYKGITDKRSDIYSLGALFHYMLTGINPEKAQVSMFTFEKIRSLNQDVSEKLEEIILKMTELKAEDRAQNIGDIIIRFENNSHTLVNKEKQYNSVSIDNKKPNNFEDIFESVKNDNLKAVEIYITNGMDVNIKDNSGWSPLHYAADRGNNNVVRLLIESRADVNIKSNEGKTPLHIAVQKNKVEIIKLLLKKGANINLSDRLGKTPLHLSLWNQKAGLTILLIKNGANVNAKDISGQTPLHISSLNGYLGVTKFLLQNGADPNIKDYKGRTPVDMATKSSTIHSILKIRESGWFQRLFFED